VFLKLISEGGAGFEVIEVRRCFFRKHPEPVAIVDADTPQMRTFPLVGNAYLLNQDGKTIETLFVNGHADRKAGK
jgi:hypothetical protein